MKKTSLSGSKPKEMDKYLAIPRRETIQKDFWFVNAGLLSNSNYDKAVLFIGTYKLNSTDFLFTLFMGIKYLIHYIELFTFDGTPLLTECINKQIKYIQLLLGKQKRSRKYLNYKFITKLQFVFNNLQTVETTNYVCRQLYIDQLERFCSLFATRLKIWIKNSRLQAYLVRFGYDPFRSAAIYNSFLIPNLSKYIDPLFKDNQKFIEKIEAKCHCKITLSGDNECYFLPENITLEVMFDIYHGNYPGFIEMLGYIVKILNPTKYFVKSLRTILIEGSILYNILTNVPIKKLKYLEKKVTAGCPMSPFLNPDSISKQFISIVAMIMKQDKDFNELETRDSSKIEDSFQESDSNLNSQVYYTRHSTSRELSKLKESTETLNYSHQLLKYFQQNYEKVMTKTNSRDTLQQNSVVTSKNESSLKSLIQFLKSSSSNKADSKRKFIYQQTTSPPILIHDAISEKRLFQTTDRCFEFEETFDTQTKNINVNSSINQNINPLGDNIFPMFRDYDLLFNSNKLQNVQGQTVNGTCEMNRSNDSEIGDMNGLLPSEQFTILLNESFNEHYNHFTWLNHKMRLMIRCNTTRTEDDLKYPYIFEKRSIRDRLMKKYDCERRSLKEKSSFSRYPKAYSKLSRDSSHRTLVTREDCRIMSHMDSRNSIHSVSSSSSSSDQAILTINDLKKELPNFIKYIENFDKNMLDIFIRRKLFKKQNWINFLERRFNFETPKDLDMINLCNTEIILNKTIEKHSDRIEKFDVNVTKRIYGLLILLTYNAITEKDFLQMLSGEGVYFPFIKKIIKSRSSFPTYIGHLNKQICKNFKVKLSHCLCQIMHDLIQLNFKSSDELLYIYSIHLAALGNIINKLKDNDIKSAFRILNIEKDYAAVSNIHLNKGDGRNRRLMNLAEQTSLIHQIIFKVPCCSYKMNKHLGLRILYHSMQLEDRINVVEPFLKLPSDRRIRKIEKICNCLITLRTGKHPIIPINQYFVDIFYDFETGNHFGTIELLKNMMTPQQRTLPIQDHRTLVLYPTGELWAFRDTEWLKKCYNTYQEEVYSVDNVDLERDKILKDK